MRVGDVKFDPNGRTVKLHFPGIKTMGRTETGFACVPDLKGHLLRHPDKNNQSAPLWYTWKGGYYKMRGIEAVLRTISKRALGRNVGPHKMRKTAASFWGAKLYQSEMNEIMGWSPRSKVAYRYILESEKTARNKMLGAYGEEIEAEEDQPLVTMDRDIGAADRVAQLESRLDKQTQLLAQLLAKLPTENLDGRQPVAEIEVELKKLVHDK